MRVKELSDEVLEQIRSTRFDRIVEKHEGPEWWASVLRWYEPEFMTIAGHDVLLPIPASQHPNVSILKSIESRDGGTLTIFLKDTTFVKRKQDEPWSAGFVTICDRMPGSSFYLASFYHEWFILPEFGPVTPEQRKKLFGDNAR